MKKFSNILNESISIEEIEDYFLSINDSLGEPTKRSIGRSSFTIYEFEWRLGIELDRYNDVSQIDKVSVFLDSIKELKTSQLRISDYDIDFRIFGVILSVRVTPKSKPTGNYKFYIGQDHRQTTLKYSEIIRFFKENGYSVTKIEETEDEVNQSSSITIYTNASRDINGLFARTLENEFEENESEMVSDFSISAYDNYINISPDFEKSYISVVKQ